MALDEQASFATASAVWNHVWKLIHIKLQHITINKPEAAKRTAHSLHGSTSLLCCKELFLYDINKVPKIIIFQLVNESEFKQKMRIVPRATKIMK